MTDTAVTDEPTGHYRAGQLLAVDAHADRVAATLSALGLRGLEREAPDPVGLVRFRWTSGEDAGRVCDQVKRACRRDWPEWKVHVSPNHVLGRLVDPESGVVATSADMGGPATPPEATGARFAARTVDDVAGTGVTVGVIDTGVMDHPWLAGSYLATPGDFDTVAELDPHRLDPQDGHGTFVTGLILQQAPGATVRVVRVLDARGEAEIKDVAGAVKRLGEAGVDVINLSLGGYSRRNEHMMAFTPALASLPPSTVVVAAAGNHRVTQGGYTPARSFWPAAMPEVLAVAALASDREGDVRLAPFSNYGAWVDLSTLGADVVSTFLDREEFRGWARWSGTSFAAPRVAGAIAARMTENGRRVRSAVEAKRLLLAEAEGRPFDGSSLGRGGDPGPGRFVRLPAAVEVRDRSLPEELDELVDDWAEARP